MAAAEGPITPTQVPAGPDLSDPTLDNTITNVSSPDSHRLTFPPFPKPPAGVNIVSFADFKEGGIRLQPGPNDEEVDASGACTIAMRIRHGTDVCKTNTKRKRDIEEAKKRKEAGEKSRKKEWWEVWEERAESNRHCVGFHSSWANVPRLQAAAAEFTRDHVWPAQSLTQTGPKYIWDKFLLFIGLPENGENSLGKDAKKRAMDEEVDFDEDEEASDDDVMADESTSRIVEVDDDEPVSGHVHRKLDSNEARIQFFLEDPESAIKVFMSSHSWRKGYVWSEPNLAIIPRMVGYFVHYLLRSKVFPELQADLRRALKPIAIAQIELPQSAAFMKLIPDDFAEGCKGCFGQRADGYTVAQIDFPEDPKPKADETGEEPHNKKQKVESGGWGDAAGGWGDNNESKAGDGWASVQPGSGWEAIEEVAPDPVEASEPNPWATDDTAWEPKPKVQPHFAMFGPSTLPLTHRPAIVERSMRRIKSILPPNPNPPNATPAEGPEAGAVEIDLDAQLCKIVLAPMPDWDGGEAPVYSRPSILESSEGPVVKEGAAEPNKDAPASGSATKPHDPFNDEITLLIGADQANLLQEGMGLGGIFVQLVRQDGQGKKKKKGKSKKPPVYWYLEEIAFVAVSCWTVTS